MSTLEQSQAEVIECQQEWEDFQEEWDDFQEDKEEMTDDEVYEKEQQLQGEVDEIKDRAIRGAEDSLAFIPDDLEVPDFIVYGEWRTIVDDIVDAHGGNAH